MNLLFSNYYTMSSNKKIYALVIAILLCSTNINAQKAYTYHENNFRTKERPKHNAVDINIGGGSEGASAELCQGC